MHTWALKKGHLLSTLTKGGQFWILKDSLYLLVVCIHLRAFEGLHAFCGGATPSFVRGDPSTSTAPCFVDFIEIS